MLSLCLLLFITVTVASGQLVTSDKVDLVENKMQKRLEEEEPVVMLRRQDGSVDFERPWSDYKYGFGDEDGELWVGLETLHKLTAANPAGLNVTMETRDGYTFWAYYSFFRVEPERNNYTLYVGGYYSNSTAGDALTNNNGRPFSTIDNDRYDCSKIMRGGWWYNYCSECNPTGLYMPDGKRSHVGINWLELPGYDAAYSLKRMVFTLYPV